MRRCQPCARVLMGEGTRQTARPDLSKSPAKKAPAKKRAAASKSPKDSSDQFQLRSLQEEFEKDRRYEPDEAVLLDFYEKMLLIRRFEEKAGQLYGLGLIGGFCHLYIGQE